MHVRGVQSVVGWISLSLFAIAATGGGTARAQSYPIWSVMQRDAHQAFVNADDSPIQRVARVGEPRVVEKKTATEVVPHLYQDVDVIYEGKFHQLERQRMTLHYEKELGGWALRTFSWGEVVTVRPGVYPPAPPPPSTEEIEQLVRDQGVADAQIPADRIEKIVVKGKPSVSWEYEKHPVALFDYALDLYVQDSVQNPSANPPVVWKTRYVCSMNAQLAFDSGMWDLRDTDCGGEGCRLGTTCPDLWKPGARKPGAPATRAAKPARKRAH
jgi:hypothetical protein